MTLIDPALQTHLEQPLTTLARLWLITRADGLRLGFTDYSQPLKIGARTFDAAAGFTATASVSDNTASVNNSEVESYLDSDAISSADIQAGRYYDAKIEVFLVNYMDLPPSLPHPKAPSVLTGYVGEVEAYGEDSFRFEVRGLTQHLGQKTGLTCQELCQANLGDSRCKVNLDPYTFTATIDVVGPSNRIFTASSLTQPPDYFGDGKVMFISGANAGLSKEIMDHNAGGQLGLAQPMPFLIVVGDQVSVQAGCRKTMAACNSFLNIKNHQGWPHLPGENFLISGKGGVSS